MCFVKLAAIDRHARMCQQLQLRQIMTDRRHALRMPFPQPARTLDLIGVQVPSSPTEQYGYRDQIPCVQTPKAWHISRSPKPCSSSPSIAMLTTYEAMASRRLASALR